MTDIAEQKKLLRKEALRRRRSLTAAERQEKSRLIAEKLLTESMALLPRGISSVVMEVRSQNIAALALYNKLGFEKLGVRKNFYSVPKDNAVVMQYNKKV